MTTAQARVAELADLEHHLVTIKGWLSEMDGARGFDAFVADEARSVYSPLERLSAAISNADEVLVTGTYDGFPVGLGLARLSPIEDGQRTASVDILLVDQAARGVGVGEAVFGLILDWAREHGVVRVDVSALPGDRDTKNYFEGEGLKARLLTLSRDLG